MTAGGSAPRRASGTGGTARYGARWRARDAAQSVRFWLARASLARSTGTVWVIAGPAVLITAWASGPIRAWALVPGLFMICVGTALLAWASLRERR